MPTDIEVLKARWRNGEEFYAERDHRTSLEVENLHGYVHRRVEILVDPESAGEITTQRIALLASNLTCRWSRNVSVFVPSVPLAEPLDFSRDGSLGRRIAREMREADPFGNAQVQEPGDSTDPSTLRLFVGPWRSNANVLAPEDYLVDARGWSAIGHRAELSCGSSCLPAAAPAAALAAAIGAGDLFKRAIGHPRSEWIGAINWCTWRHHLAHPDDPCASDPPVTSEVDLGELLLAGVGAIGSALLYILAQMPVRGRVTVLDRDDVETSNLNRSPLFTATDAALHHPKTQVAVALLRAIGVEVDAVSGNWREYGEQLGRHPFDVWVSLTNEEAAWAEVPFQLPPIVLHGTTTSGWGIAFGRHIPRVEDCTACRLPRPHVEFRGPCSEGDVSATEEAAPVRASLPFLSSVSAALIAAELLKLRVPRVSSLPNSVAADFRLGLPAVLAVLRGSSPNCAGCKIAQSPLWISHGGRGRYRSLSDPNAVAA